MKTTDATLLAHLNTHNQFFIAHLYTFTLPALGGAVLTFTGWDKTLTVGGTTFTPAAISGGTVRQGKGNEVSTVDVRISQGTFQTPPQVGGVSLAPAAANGSFDGATVKMARLFLIAPGDSTSTLVPLPWFQGRVAEVKPSGLGVDMTFKAGLERANRPFPFRVFQPSCPYALYSPACGVVAAPTTTTVSAGGSVNILIVDRTDSPGWWNLGSVTLPGGTTRQIISSQLGATTNFLTLSNALATYPAIGSSVTLLRGCDKSLLRCQVLGGNFGGFPFIPAPETTYTLPTPPVG